jgi:hypothetical protein
MPATGIERRARRARAAARKDSELIVRAGKRTDLAGTALSSAAGDLDNAHSRDGNALTGLAEMVREEAGRVANLVEDNNNHTPGPAARGADTGRS